MQRTNATTTETSAPSTPSIDAAASDHADQVRELLTRMLPRGQTFQDAGGAVKNVIINPAKIYDVEVEVVFSAPVELHNTRSLSEFEFTPTFGRTTPTKAGYQLELDGKVSDDIHYGIVASVQTE